ncbi:hypothetical protein APHAL10511_006787 [Amanita phalloides]|nr:hypothetical protein APHAL10511_006787 [Amanita phalloides]
MFSKSLDSMPVELVCLIFTYLDIPDLLNCSLLSRHFRRMIYDSSQMQYAIELVKCRMVCVAPLSQHPSSARRLRILREREHAWMHMRWKERHKLRLPFSGSVYDFVGGIYGNGGDDNDGTTASISFLKLPAANHGIHQDQIPMRHLWSHSTPDLLIFDFTMDPSQDLLVLLTLAPPVSKNIYELQLRTLSTNEPHPLAFCPGIPCISGSYQDIALSDLSPAVTMQIIGDYVAVLFKELVFEFGAHLEIWNWKLGPTYSSAMHCTASIDDFTFLSEDSFLLARPSEKLEVYKFIPPTTYASVPQCIMSLELPPLSSRYKYWYITMSSNPTPGYVPSFPSSSSVKANVNFEKWNVGGTSSEQLHYPTPFERVLACCLYIFDTTQPQDTSVRSFVFFVNVGTFLKPLEYWLSILPNHYFAPPLYLLDQAADSKSFQINFNSLTAASHPSNNAVTLTLPNAVANTTGNDSKTHRSLQPDDSKTDSDQASSAHSTASSASSSYQVADGKISAPAETAHRTWRLPPDSQLSIPWEVWGPPNTRWFNGNWRTDWQHATYGLRTADSVRIKQKDGARGKGKAKANSDVVNNGFENGAGYENDSSSEIELDEEMDTFGEEDEAEMFNDGPSPLRVLRVRDYNPYSVAQAEEYLQTGVVKKRAKTESPLFKHETMNGKGKGDTLGNSRLRVVTQPSITPAHGVYKEDIKSWLPYVEVLSEEKFDVTDVMLDDRRLLLLKRRSRGLSIGIDVLMM